MNITRAEVAYRPITIVLETEDDRDKLLAIVGNVAANRINHTPQVIRAAIDIRDAMLDLVNRD